ncbi:SAP30-binding protein isoform X3 [Saimiri boliviensis]|uniref:SAP30-binding protein isoform X3 n=1 Tax=Saimiri boliviensis TaxID=27679 RepID=UPI000533E5F7|nr:SAP30-binding protein isoform X3 [Saimiri boliviensis boliviensis]
MYVLGIEGIIGGGDWRTELKGKTKRVKILPVILPHHLFSSRDVTQQPQLGLAAHISHTPCHLQGHKSHKKPQGGSWPLTLPKEPLKWQDNTEAEKRDPQELVASFSERVRNMSPDEIKIPPEPPGRCSNHLQDKIQKLYERKIKEGMDMNYIIQRKKEFRNPSIYEKLIQFCAIDELGTNYPKDMFDPHGWSEDSYYEALAKAQKIEMDKLEKAKKERTKIEFVTGTKKGTTTNATATTTTTASTAVADAQKRKSKWDSAIPVTTIAQPTILTTTATLPAVVTVTTSASGSKTTVISAVGTIVKKAKQ